MSTSMTDDEGAADLELLNVTNQLLSQIGLVDASSKTAKKVTAIEELQTVASSMFVAVYEARFHVRLDGIIRNPMDEADYGHNAQIVINALEDKIHIGLHHISGLSIAQGDRKAITNLVRILLHLVSTAGSTSMSVGSDDEEDYADVDYSALLGVRGANAQAHARAQASRRHPTAATSPGGSGKKSPGRATGAAGGRKAKTVGSSPQRRPNSAPGGGRRLPNGATVHGRPHHSHSHPAVVPPLEGDTTNGFSSPSTPSPHSTSSVSSLDRDDMLHSASSPAGMAARAAEWMAVQRRRQGGSAQRSRSRSAGAGAGAGQAGVWVAGGQVRGRGKTMPSGPAGRSLHKPVPRRRIAASPPPPVRVRSSGYGRNTDWQPAAVSGREGNRRRGTTTPGPTWGGKLHLGVTPTTSTRPQWLDSTTAEATAPARSLSPAKRRVKMHTAAVAGSGSPSDPSWLKEVTGPLRHSISRELYSSYDDLVNISASLHDSCNKSAQNSAQQMENLQRWTKKLEDARKRREEMQRVSLTKSCEMNQRHDEVRNRIAERRWVDDLARQNESFEQRVASQDYVMLKKAYRELLKQLHSWKLDELKEIRERVGVMKDNAKWHIKSLEQLFEDRLALLKEQEARFADTQSKLFAAGRTMEGKLKGGVGADDAGAIQRKVAKLQQKRDAMMLERREALSRLNDLNFMLLSNNIEVPSAVTAAVNGGGIGAAAAAGAGGATGKLPSKKAGQRAGVNVHHPSRFYAGAAAPAGRMGVAKGAKKGRGKGATGTSNAPGSKPTTGSGGEGESMGNLRTQRVTNPSADYYYRNIDHVTIPTSTTSTAADEDDFAGGGGHFVDVQSGDVSFGGGETDASSELSEYHEYEVNEEEEEGAAGAEEQAQFVPQPSGFAGSARYVGGEEGSGDMEEEGGDLEQSRSDYEYEDVEGGNDDDDDDEEDEMGGGGDGDDVEDNLMYNMINDAVRMQLQQEHQLHQREWSQQQQHMQQDDDGVEEDVDEEEGDAGYEEVGDGEADDASGDDAQGADVIYPSQSQQEPVQQPRQHIHYFGAAVGGNDGNLPGSDSSSNPEHGEPSDHSTSSASTTDVGNNYNRADSYYG